jgi:Ser/Thr protein kinase RdoA (MazF antagonist)
VRAAASGAAIARAFASNGDYVVLSARTEAGLKRVLASITAVGGHHAGLAQTLLHGDAHFGNTYLTEDGGGGLLDWQVNCRGFAMFDVGYLLHTALSVHTRR